MLNPVVKSAHDYSVHSIMLLCQSILGKVTFELDARIEAVQSAKRFDQQSKL